MNQATLRLFNAIQIDSKKKAKNIFLEKTIKDGYILSPEVANVISDSLLKEISDLVGISGEKANSSFHKSWKIIEESSIESLVIQQILHYFTTYGFEELGIYNENSIYIPREKLEIPDLNEDIKLVVIKGLTSEELLGKIIELGFGIALKKETLEDIMSIIEKNKYNSKFIKLIQNRELKSKLYDFYGVVPDEPIEYLRFIINKLTGESLLIKNKYLIEKIKELKTPLHIKTLDKLLEQSPINLAEVFFRYKPLFLALKSISKNKTFFNRLRKKANILHKPMPEDFLNSITAKIKNGKKLLVKTFETELNNASIFRKIRLAYALKYRTVRNDSIVYRIRNGRGYATDFEFTELTKAKDAFNIVIDSIVKGLNVMGKIIYIPENVNYAFPATEKMFTGNFPTGSYVSIPEDMILGIHWFDRKEGRVDLDLSTIGVSGKTGWDSNYRMEGNSVLFSGDMTAAPKPNGSSELFYIKQGDTDDKIMFVNYYNQSKGDEVEATIIVAHEKPYNFGRNYMVNPNNIIAKAKINISKKQNILGLITRVGGENRFYFANTAIGNSITSSSNDYADKAREYFANSLVNSIDFKDILKKAGAKIVNEKPKKNFIDLSPEILDRITIINLLK